MYEIDRRFLNQDGSLNFDMTEKACRKARARVAGDGYRKLKSILSETFFSNSNRGGPSVGLPGGQQTA